jgi:hydroxypyruvate isomerase
MSAPLDRSALRWSRREALRTAAALAAAGGLAGATVAPAAADEPGRIVTKGRIKQSVCAWCYKMSLDELCSAAKRMGLVGIDLIGPRDFPTLKKYGLISTMVPSNPLDRGLCDLKYHKMSLEAMNAAIEATSKEGWRNVICMSGNRRGIDEKTGMNNTVKALKEIAPVAEKARMILNLELLNSKVDHKDYMCDHSAWGVEVCKRVGSPNVKLLYDIYHMQIMEGDVIRTIQKDHEYFGHYHTGGNPGRHELDDTQELNYKPICKAIADSGFTGFVAHEFIPTRDPLTSLAEAVALCDV